MEALEGGGGADESSKLRDLIQQFNAHPTEGAMFDASQYAFFGDDLVEEVDLGGLDEEVDFPPAGFDDEVYQLDQEESEGLDIRDDELADIFAKLNTTIDNEKKSSLIENWESLESSSTDWLDHQRSFDGESTQESERWLYRASSYPEQQQQNQSQNQLPQPHQRYSSEPILVQNTPFTSYPPPGGGAGGAPHGSPNNASYYSNSSYHPSGHQMPFSHTQLQMSPPLPHGVQFGGNRPDLAPIGHPVNSHIQNQWVNRNSVYPGDHSSVSSNLLQQPPHQNGQMAPQLMPHQQAHQQRLQHQYQRPFANFNHHLSPSPPMMNNFDMLSVADLRDQRTRPMLRGRQGMTYSPHGSSDTSRHRSDNGWPRCRSKHMTADEIENIQKMQLAATHSNDPYVDDYYHQACLAKKPAGANMKHPFCPNNLRDGSSRPRPNSEPHPFLQVDALGRVSFSSVRRPRPLLEVEPPNSSGPGSNEQNLLEKPLEQEPMLAARVAIEDGISLLLDVDDIDRFLEFKPFLDFGTELRQRRQLLLEGLATYLQLVDPLGKNGHTVELAPKDDLVFLRLVSLPKGRKLLSRYLQLLSPGDELIRVVSMAIFRHLRFFFAVLPSDPGAAETTLNVARTVSSCVKGMELKALAACLASVVCSAELPPLRPLGSPVGDGASVVLKSVLERASDILRDPHAAGNCSMPRKAFWQASFDAFFGLLTKHCFNKYDTIMQSFMMQSPSDDAAKAISGEMPVELLRASLPHTNEQQRKVLSDFAQRSIPSIK